MVRMTWRQGSMVTWCQSIETGDITGLHGNGETVIAVHGTWIIQMYYNQTLSINVADHQDRVAESFVSMIIANVPLCVRVSVRGGSAGTESVM